MHPDIHALRSVLNKYWNVRVRLFRKMSVDDITALLADSVESLLLYNTHTETIQWCPNLALFGFSTLHGLTLADLVHRESRSRLFGAIRDHEPCVLSRIRDENGAFPVSEVSFVYIRPNIVGIRVARDTGPHLGWGFSLQEKDANGRIALIYDAIQERVSHVSTSVTPLLGYTMLRTTMPLDESIHPDDVTNAHRYFAGDGVDYDARPIRIRHSDGEFHLFDGIGVRPLNSCEFHVVLQLCP